MLNYVAENQSNENFSMNHNRTFHLAGSRTSKQLSFTSILNCFKNDLKTHKQSIRIEPAKLSLKTKLHSGKIYLFLTY